MTNHSSAQASSAAGTISPLEIERKWMVNGWPETMTPLSVLKEESMRQGYITVEPTVRIREESVTGGATAYILCFKSKGLLTRKEIEIEISREKFLQLEDLIALPLIPKIRRTYKLPSGLSLEVPGSPGSRWELTGSRQGARRNAKPAHVFHSRAAGFPENPDAPPRGLLYTFANCEL